MTKEEKVKDLQYLIRTYRNMIEHEEGLRADLLDEYCRSHRAYIDAVGRIFSLRGRLDMLTERLKDLDDTADDAAAPW